MTSPVAARLRAFGVVLVVAALASAVGSVPWLRAFEVGGAPAMLAVCAVAPVAISAAATGWRAMAPAWAYLLSLAGLVAVTAVFAGPHPSSVFHALATVPARLVSETLPLSGGRDLLAPAAVITWVGAAASAETALRAPRSRVWLAPPVVIFVVAFAMTAAAGGTETVAAAALLAVLAAGSVAGRPGARRSVAAAAPGAGAAGTVAAGSAGEGPAGPLGRLAGSGLPRRLGAVVIAAATAVAGGAILPRLPALSRQPAALQRPVPTATDHLIDPLAATEARRDASPSAPPTPLVTVTTAGSSSGYLATAVLGAYDGGTWSFEGRFVPTGGRIPAPPAGDPVAAGPTVAQRYQLAPAFPPGPLPALQRPTSVRGAPVSADATTGMIVPSSGAAAGAYTVSSVVAPSTLAGTPAADGIAAGGLPAAEDTVLPEGAGTDVAEVLRFLARGTGLRPSPTVAFLQAAAAYLGRSDRRFTPGAARPAAAAGGTALAEVIDATTVARVATPEQFATLVAVVARYLGVPSIVATGYRIPDAGRGPVPAGRYRVTNRDAWTWAEVPVAGLGWVVVDATPAADSAQSAPPPEQVRSTPTTLQPPRANAVPRPQDNGGHALAPPAHLPRSARSASHLWADVVAAVVAALVLALVAGPGQAAARRALRRRARAAGDPGRRAAGAWLEMVDDLGRAGMTVLAADTASEVARGAARHFGDEVEEKVAAVGSVAERAVFSGQATDEATAAGAWAAADDAWRLMWAGLDRRQRARALVSVGRPGRPG